MREFIRNMKINYVTASILYLVLGLVLLIWPGITSSVICLVFGVLLLIYGAVTIIAFLIRDSKAGSFLFDLVLGIVGVALGLLLLLRPDILLSILPVVLGIYIIIDALLNVKRAIELHRMAYQRWWVILVLSLVSAALGVVILLRPYLTAEMLIRVIGFVFLYTGISDLWTLFKLGRVTKSWRKDHPIEVDVIDIQ